MTTRPDLDCARDLLDTIDQAVASIRHSLAVGTPPAMIVAQTIVMLGDAQAKLIAQASIVIDATFGSNPP